MGPLLGGHAGKPTLGVQPRRPLHPELGRGPRSALASPRAAEARAAWLSPGHHGLPGRSSAPRVEGRAASATAL